MRRTDREITDVTEKLKIIDGCKVCRVGMALDNLPYVVPLNFGYEYADDTLTLYFHGAREGKKLDILRQNPNVCVEMDARHRLVEGDIACEYSFAFESVIAFGTAEFLETAEDKSRALKVLMQHQTGKDIQWGFDKRHLDAVSVFKVTVSSFSGKRKEMPSEPTSGSTSR
jgi:nitroimidazol reductase NimA-like FMN-containing flavoprotein (pyridoxamine 5'-phosphate oxidase superfamily)